MALVLTPRFVLRRMCRSTCTAPAPMPGVIQLSAAVYQVDENGGTVTIIATRTGGSDGIVGVSYATTDGTALAGSDYMATAGTLEWADGDGSNKSFDVTIIDDGDFESDRSFFVDVIVDILWILLLSI